MGFCSKCGEIIRSGTCPCGGDQGQTLTDMGDGSGNVAASYSNKYLSNGLSQGVDTGLRRMLDMKIEKRDCHCSSCNKPLYQDGDVFVGQNDDLPYCKPCYSDRYSVGNCHQCDGAVVGLGDQYVKENGKLYHRECYKGTACCRCLDTIMGEAVQASGSSYHPDCFKCGECEKVLEDSFVSHNGQVYCKPCVPKTTKINHVTNYGSQSGFKGNNSSSSSSPKSFNESNSNSSNNNGKNNNSSNTNKPTWKNANLPVNHGINSSAGSGVDDTLTEADKRNLNNESVEKRQKELQNIRAGNDKWVNVKDKCLGCAQEMYASGVETSFGMYHYECFLCKGCGKEFQAGKYNFHNGAAYHTQCVPKKSSSGVVCGLCDKSISGSYLSYKTGKVHPTCFNCTKCKVNLNGKAFGEHDGKPHCGTCLQTATAASNRTTVDRGIRGGFTVDHTGKKVGRTYGGSRVQGVAPIAPESKKCFRCDKFVYEAEKVSGPQSQAWHKACLTCKDCKAPLDTGKLASHGKEAYCKNCHGKNFGPKGVGFGQGAGALTRSQ